MNRYKADLHIHSLLSPCGSLEMSPKNIVKTAIEKGIDIIAITDHNSTRQCKIVEHEAKKTNLKVIFGAEVTTKEEIHCLTFFDTLNNLDIFQNYIDHYLPDIKNDVNIFGYQVVVDEMENIIYEEEKLLISAIDQNINEIEEKVHSLNGLFIPAHINKLKYSLISQLGFIPFDLRFDAFELFKIENEESFINQNHISSNTSILHNSDAHFLEQIGSSYNIFEIESPTFSEIKMAISQQNDRKIVKR